MIGRRADCERGRRPEHAGSDERAEQQRQRKEKTGKRSWLFPWSHRFPLPPSQPITAHSPNRPMSHFQKHPAAHPHDEKSAKRVSCADVAQWTQRCRQSGQARLPRNNLRPLMTAALSRPSVTGTSRGRVGLSSSNTLTRAPSRNHRRVGRFGGPFRRGRSSPAQATWCSGQCFRDIPSSSVLTVRGPVPTLAGSPCPAPEDRPPV